MTMSTTHKSRTIARSFLYVPANQPKLFGKAADGGVDAMILDLEDAVPLAEKDQARDAVADWLAKNASSGSTPPRAQRWVRINAESIDRDTDAVVQPELDGLFLAKCSLRGLDELTARLDTLEHDRGLSAGSIGVIGLLETAKSLLCLPAMAEHHRLITFGIGEVDLMGDLRMSRSERSAASVDALRTQVVVQCAAAGLAAPVAPTDTAFRDLDAFRQTSRKMLELGFRSRTAIHPSQVPVIHEIFTPDESELASASDVLDRFEAAHGGVTVDAAGRLIDAAVVREARETLNRAPYE